MWQEIPTEVRQPVLESEQQLGLLSEIVNYLEKNPQADTEELLVRWSDDPRHPDLLRQAQKTLEIDADALPGEFSEGLIRLCDSLRSQRRRQALSDLKESPNVEELKKYWQLHGLGRDLP
jgi:hypothetical protein